VRSIPIYRARIEPDHLASGWAFRVFIGEIRQFIRPLILFPCNMHNGGPGTYLEEFEDFGMQHLQHGVLYLIDPIDLPDNQFTIHP